MRMLAAIVALVLCGDAAQAQRVPTEQEPREAPAAPATRSPESAPRLRATPEPPASPAPERGLRGGDGQAATAAGGQLRPVRAPREVVAAPDGSAEFLVLVPDGQAQAARTVLDGRGAAFLRERRLPALRHRMLIYRFPPTLTLEAARAVLRASAPAAEIDLHHLYGLSQAPRLYAATMIGDPPGGGCRLARAVRIGMVDGPVNPRHDALRGAKITRHDARLPGEAAGAADHGTAVAQIIAGTPDAGGLAGFAQGAHLFAADAFARGRNGTTGRLENIAAGLDWLTAQGVAIVNLSMSGPPNASLDAVMGLLSRRGILIVAAAGNDGSRSPRYPAASPYSIAITAVDARGRAYRKANSGRHIDFSAPGVEVWAATATGAGYQSGTSLAAPIVTAVLARHLAGRQLGLDDARARLKRSARDLGPSGRDTVFGHGLISGGC